MKKLTVAVGKGRLGKEVANLFEAIGADVSPLLIALSVGLAASGAFMLPVGTLPNALVFGTGKIPLPHMLRAGFYLNLASAAIITIGLALAAPFL